MIKMPERCPAIGQVVVNDGLGTIANVISEVQRHDYLGLDGKQRRWVISILSLKRKGCKQAYTQINDSQIAKWIHGPDIEQKEPSEPKYVWPMLLNGQIWQLEQGEDFTCKPETFKLLAKKWAKRLGVRLNINVLGTTIVLQGVTDVPKES